jgi:Dehydrogenases with different specificities (related to short-chain alcohol dehydrogenases)
MQKANPKKPIRKPQSQDKPGNEYMMKPPPIFENPAMKSALKLNNKIAFITGGDSGIGRAVSVLFAKEGADIAIVYLNEDRDAKDTKMIVEQEHGRKCLLIRGDISKETFCNKAVSATVRKFGRIDILVNNAATHTESKTLADIGTRQLLKTFATNIFSMFWITKKALENMQAGGVIINTTSVTAYRGSGALIDYASTKGAIVSFTRSLSANLVERKIRVNAVAPGPIWTPLIVSTFAPDKVAKHGSDSPMKRAGEPAEVAPCYLFLACDDSTYITGQVLHPNGGEIVNG